MILNYCYWLMVDILIQVLFHPWPPSTGACWPQRSLAGWWRHACREQRDHFTQARPNSSYIWIHLLQKRSYATNTASQSSLTSPPPRCRSRSVCRWNQSSFWHTSAAGTSPVYRSPHHSVNSKMWLHQALIMTYLRNFVSIHNKHKKKNRKSEIFLSFSAPHISRLIS